MLGVDLHRGDVGTAALHQRLEVSLVLPQRPPLARPALEPHGVADVLTLHRLVDDALQLHHLAPAETHVPGDQELRPSVDDPVAQRPTPRPA